MCATHAAGCGDGVAGHNGAAAWAAGRAAAIITARLAERRWGIGFPCGKGACNRVVVERTAVSWEDRFSGLRAMPIYVFRCDDCGEKFERLQKLSDPD